MFLLCSKDEYGSLSTFGTDEEIKNLVEQAEKAISTENMDNPLGLDEQKRDFTSFLPVFFKRNKRVKNVFYGGKSTRGEYLVSFIKDKELVTTELSKLSSEEVTENLKGVTVRFYIGTHKFSKDKSEDYYAETPGGKLIEDIDNTLLGGKTIFYIQESR